VPAPPDASSVYTFSDEAEPSHTPRKVCFWDGIVPWCNYDESNGPHPMAAYYLDKASLPDPIEDPNAALDRQTRWQEATELAFALTKTLEAKEGKMFAASADAPSNGQGGGVRGYFSSR